jgi:hypothetical protein
MPGTRWLALVFVAGLLLAVLFAFTLIGLVAEGLAALAALTLVLKGVSRVARRSPANHA